MKRKLGFIFVYIFLVLISVVNVNAETYKCEYRFEKDNEIYIIEYDTSAGTLKNHSEKQDESVIVYNYEYTYEYYFADDEIKFYDVNVCPVLFMVKQEANISENYNSTTYEIYSDSFVRDSSEICFVERDKFCLEGFANVHGYIYTGTLTKSDINKNNTLKSVCPTYSKIEAEIISLYSKYKNCSGQECSNLISQAKNSINKLKTTCNSILTYRDIYVEKAEDEEGKEIKDACVDACLNISTRLDQLKKDYGITSGRGKGQCGFSQRLLYWIANIVRWIKYIIPVAVIALGILDFIKAVGADKDDEMKKAQGRFVKRLIAAALIFIIPFIIEIVLDKMGFGEYISGCGIIDL